MSYWKPIVRIIWNCLVARSFITCVQFLTFFYRLYFILYPTSFGNESHIHMKFSLCNSICIFFTLKLLDHQFLFNLPKYRKNKRNVKKVEKMYAAGVAAQESVYHCPTRRVCTHGFLAATIPNTQRTVLRANSGNNGSDPLITINHLPFQC